jgi:hypothetical protein
MALAVAVPMVAVALSGAAANPTVTYHGVFDHGALTGDCLAMFPSGAAWSGIWNLQMRSPAGSPLTVDVMLKYEGGRPHAVWRLPFTKLDPGTTNVAMGEWIPWEGHDEARVALDKSGHFTYHLNLNLPDDPETQEVDPFNCDAHFTGSLTN